MKFGDIIINPYAPKTQDGVLTPEYATIYLKTVDNDYDGYGLKCLTYDGQIYIFTLPTSKPFKVIGHLNLFDAISKVISRGEENVKKET